ncbi:predicted protein [Botrytis cinerea T4]|uniref:Uncharacterized protein n=1 Tax=Botryotinia fuckeliana (strain T4) TaxID=999810 RepID=G2YS38_BOTF4|nr:predicted protein [Botrytis cinerea T4]
MLSLNWNAFIGTASEPTREEKTARKRAVKSKLQIKKMTVLAQAHLLPKGLTRKIEEGALESQA